MADATMHPPLPTSEDAFAQDDRISFSRLDNKYIAVNDEDGTELEFDQATRKWVLPPDHDDDNERELQQQDAHLAELAQSGSTTTAQDVSASRKRKDAPRNGNEKLDAKLADWSDDDTAALPTAAASKWDRLVVLRHMFTLAELEEDPAALLEIKEDVREECAKLGAVTNVVLFDEEPDGVVSVKFRDPQAAQACIAMMHGRSFDGRVVEASLATGREKFRRSKGGQADEEDE
ncbi:Putative 2-hydroxyacid dehydrogenase UNK4.10 [Verticillium dahliae VDG1]|nr:Putative 2-hydroxyacid dehydrogenase UNK4.10 [Verticillium dahliae VDG1]